MAKLGESGLRWLLEFILNKFSGKADTNHTHKDYLTAHPKVNTNVPTSSDSTLSLGGTFKAYSDITKDANGHITGGTLTTYTLPSSSGSEEEITAEMVENMCKEIWGDE